MSTKAILPGVVMLALFSSASLRAQSTPYAPAISLSPTLTAPTPAEALPMGSPGAPAVVPNPLKDIGVQGEFRKPDGMYASHWLGGSGPGCCAPATDGIITEEIYSRIGPSLTVGGGFLSARLQTGLMLGAGGQTLFFNPSNDAAWVLDLHLGYTVNNGRANQPAFNQEGVLVDVRSLHRTYVGVSLGREWFLFSPMDVGCDEGSNLRFGADVGGRLGSSHVDLNAVGQAIPNDYVRIHDVYGGPFIGLHADLEFPMGGWTGTLGFRTEWAYSYIDLVTGDNNSLHDINFLFSAGVKF